MNSLGSSRDWLAIAQDLQSEVDQLGMGRPSLTSDKVDLHVQTLMNQFDERVNNPKLYSATRKLFEDGHYPQAVEAAFKRLNNEVKKRSGLSELTGESLMRKAFSASNPRLRLNSLRTISDKDEQRGYMDLYAGAMSAIRNPRSHEHDLEDDPQVALELLTVANHLMNKLEASQRTRQRKTKS